MAPNGGRVIEIMVAEGLGFFLIDRAAIYMTVTNYYAVMVVMVIRCPARV